MKKTDPRDYPENLLFDSRLKISQNGTHKGSIITILDDTSKSMIFSDLIEILDDKLVLEGLKVGVKEKAAVCYKGKFTCKKADVNFSVKIDDYIVEQFENERFNASFPYMISVLNTHLLYKNSDRNRVNHLDFVQGEILNHPIGLLFNNSIIVGDRLVVDNLKYPVFYDAFLVSRKAYNAKPDEMIEISYEPIRRLDINYIQYIIILGVEMLK